MQSFFLAGNSTLADQTNEPYASWGQMIGQYFRPGIAIANYAKSAMSAKSFISEGRFSKILAELNPQDLLFLDFGHIDKKRDSLETFIKSLKFCIYHTRKKRGVPVLVTPVNRNIFEKNGQLSNSLGQFPEAMRSLARELKVPIIHQNLFSKNFFESLGPQRCSIAFTTCPANTWPEQPLALIDRSHLSGYGAYTMAYLIITELSNVFPALRKHLYSHLLSTNQLDFQMYDVPLSPFLSQFKNYHTTRKLL